MFPELELREGWATVALFLLMLLCMAWSIQTADWTYGLSILQVVVLVGGLLGIVLAKSRVPNRMAHLLAILAGFTWAAFLTSRVLARVSGLSPEEAVVELEWQMRSWLSAVFSGGTSAGNYMFLLLLALILWLVAYCAAWAIFRWQRVWWAVIVCGLTIMLNVTYAPANLTAYLLVFVLASLLLVVRTNLAFHQQEWRRSKIGYSPELAYQFLRAGLVVSVATIMLAWLAPRALASRPMQDVWDRVSAPWRRLQDESSRVFQDLNYRNEPAFVSFGLSMKFGGPVALSDAPIMDVRANSGRYWRAMVFHEYTSDGWRNTDLGSILVEENEQQIVEPEFELRRVVTQTITLRQNLGPQGTIAAAGQPLRSDLPLKVLVTLGLPEETADSDSEATPPPPVPRDPSVLYSRNPLRVEDSYQVVSSLTVADEESLRQAGTDYPDWVLPRYVQLPDTLPERVSELADQVTADQENPYDKAVAIEQLLRELPYNEGIEGPAPGQDGVDYFLFEAKEGYCDYYSSAMVVMLRSVGIPARYVRGYGQGTKEDGVYYVVERDGHAWPEVFFPGYGWVEFEPTAGEPVLIRPRPRDRSSDRLDARDRRELGWEDDTFEDPFAHERTGPLFGETPEPLLKRVVRWGGLALALLALGVVIVALLMVRRHRRIEGLSLAELVYEDLVYWVGRLFKLSPLVHQTPNEYGAAVIGVLPAGRQPIERIVSTYVGYRFGGQDGDGEQVEQAWRVTRRVIWRRWLRRRIEKLESLPRRLLPVAFRRSPWEAPPTPEE